MEPEYTKPWLLKAIEMATNLGFSDDVAHWNAELKKLEGK